MGDVRISNTCLLPCPLFFVNIRWSKNFRQYGKWLKVCMFSFSQSKYVALWHGYPSMGEILIVLLLFWCCPGQSIEMLDYDSVQDLSLLLDSADNRNILRRLGRSLGVPPQVIAHLQGFQDLFQYLRTSTYTLLPQLAQAAALLPNPEVVARIHRAVVNKWPLRLKGGVAMTPTVIQYFWPTLHDVTQHVGT